MSGLYIKGFQLPEKNDLYYVKVECETGKNPVATIWRKDVLGSMSFGVFECIPVPDHGRLIEKHDVFKLIPAFPEIDKLLTVEFMNALYNLPTIIQADREGEA